MAISFVLLWWHIPLALFLGGIIMMYFGSRSTLGAFGWPTTELTGSGIIGLLSAILGAILFIGGLFRGLF